MLKNLRIAENLDDNQWYFFTKFLSIMTEFFVFSIVLGLSSKKVFLSLGLFFIYELVCAFLVSYYLYSDGKIKITSTSYSHLKWCASNWLGILTNVLAMANFLPFECNHDLSATTNIVSLYFISLEITFILYVVTLLFPYKGLKIKNDTQIEGFYSLFSKEKLNVKKIVAEYIFDDNKLNQILDVGIFQDKIRQRKASNIINNLDILQNKDINAYLHLKNKVRSLSESPFWDFVSCFISLLGIFLTYSLKYTHNILSIFLKRRASHFNNEIYFFIVIFFIFALILIVFLFLLIKYFTQQRHKESYREMYMFFKESEKQNRIIFKLRPTARIFINGKRIK